MGGHGRIVLADAGNHRIETFTPSGTQVSILGADTPSPIRFTGPWNIALDRAGTMYVADRGILKLSSTGIIHGHWRAGALANATEVAATPDGTVYALTLHPVPHSNLFDRMTITKVSTSGEILATWVYPYSQPTLDALQGVAIAVAPTGDVVLSIRGQTHCHDCDGTYFRIWTLSPSGKRLSNRNATAGGRSVVVGQDNSIYNAAPGAVQHLSPSGALLATWATPGCGAGQFGNDLRLAISQQGRLIVADTQYSDGIPAGRLHTLTLNGVEESVYGTCLPANAGTIGTVMTVGPRGPLYLGGEDMPIGRVGLNGVSQGPLPNATGRYHTVVVDAHNNLYLGDLMHPSVERRSPSGTVLAHVPDLSLEDFTVGPGGRIYALPIDRAGMVQVLLPIRPGDTRGRVLRSWWMKGYTPHSGGLDPHGIALDRAGNLYIADTRHSYVLKYSSTGRLLAVWGHGQGSAPSTFSNPVGIAIDRWDRVYVLDAGNNRVEQFTTAGRLVHVWGRSGRAPGQFTKPTAIAVTAGGDVYVDDHGNSRVQVLRG